MDQPTPTPITIDHAAILRTLPHRYPFLLVDRVIDVIGGQSGIGIKNVTANENFFLGHFPGQPVMPGVLIIEAMAQSAAILVLNGLPAGRRVETVYFMSVDGVKFRRPVVPGDQLRLHCQHIHSRGPVHRYKVVAKVENAVAAEALITAMINYAKD